MLNLTATSSTLATIVTLIGVAVGMCNSQKLVNSKGQAIFQIFNGVVAGCLHFCCSICAFIFLEVWLDHTASDSLDSPYPSPMDVLVIQVCVCLLANGALMYICLYTNFYSNAATCTFVLFCCCCDAKFQPAQNFKPPHGWTQDRYMQAGILASYNTAFLPSKDGFENFGGPY